MAFSDRQKLVANPVRQHGRVQGLFAGSRLSITVAFWPRLQEKQCRFCKQALPSWKEVFPLQGLDSGSPIMSVHFNGNTYWLKVNKQTMSATIQRRLQTLQTTAGHLSVVSNAAITAWLALGQRLS